MSLFNYFGSYLHDVEIYSLESVVSSWGTNEMDYPDTPTLVTKGYIQQLSGTEVFENQRLGRKAESRLYIGMDVNIKSTDRIKYNGRLYKVEHVNNNGINNVGDHQEIGLVEINGG